MQVTKEEAANKVCPQMFMKSWENDHNNSIEYQYEYCIVDKCMAWVWVVYSTSGFPKDQNLPESEWKGRCGLCK